MNGFRIGQYVVVASRRGRVIGTISDRYCNPFSRGMEYSVDFTLKDGRWRMICIPEYALTAICKCSLRTKLAAMREFVRETFF